MARGEYNDYRGWTPPEGEDQAVDGYLVEYEDGGQPNDSRHGGYISWSPRGVFEGAYLKTGYEVAWNLPAHQQRVIAERAELQDRLEKLRKFMKESPVFQALPLLQRELLEDQERCMTEYSFILSARIREFMPGEEEPLVIEEAQPLAVLGSDGRIAVPVPEKAGDVPASGGGAEELRNVNSDGICTRCGAMFEGELEAEDHLNGPMCEEQAD